MEIFLIFLYVIINLTIVCYYIIKREDGIFTPPFIVSAISLSVMLPQLTTLYFINDYNNELIPTLCYTMITCNIAFLWGFKKGENRKLPSKLFYIDLSRCKLIILLSAIAGFGALLGIGDGVIVSLFMGFSQIAIAFSLTYFLANGQERSNIYIVSLLLGCIIVLNYTFFIYGSRGSALFLFLAVLYFLYLKYPKYKTVCKYAVITFLLLGSVVSASISSFRENLHGDIGKVDYVDNFKKAFYNSNSEVGMDLGNAAILIDYCKKSDSYNYGSIFWNGFVYNYVPERVVGKSTKESLQYIPAYEKLIEPLTHGVTTVTGYFEAFATWGYLGFFTFMIIGFLVGVIWNRAKYSSFYMILLLFSLGNIPLMVTHNLQYIFQRWELIILFSMAFCFYAFTRVPLYQDEF